MAKTGKDRDMEAADQHPAFDPARLPYFSEALSFNPLLAHPAAAMAAATAIGFGFANQMASAFFGVLQGAMEAANRQNAGVPPSAEETARPAASVVTEPVPAAAEPKAKPVRKTAAPAAPAEKKPAAGKKTVAKPAPVEAPVKTKTASKAGAKAPARKPAAAKVKARASAGTDDLKRISGIGPKLEEVLKGMGVASLAQVAAWNDADIARFDKELGFEGRIKRDDWVGQAKALLK